MADKCWGGGSCEDGELEQEQVGRQFCGFWSEVVDGRNKYGGEGPSLVSECSCVLSSGVQGREKVGLRVVQGRKQRRSNLTSGSSTCKLSAPYSLFPNDLKKGSLTTKTQRKEKRELFGHLDLFPLFSSV